MLNTTLIYIELDGEYLMLHRTKKENDLNHDKWSGVGGKCEEDESPEECARREAFEETGLSLGDLRYHGIVTFVSDEYEGEYMHLFSCEDWEGSVKECPEGDLVWVPKEEVPELPGWEGDRIFLRLMAKPHPFFSLKLCYEGDVLVSSDLHFYGK